MNKHGMIFMMNLLILVMVIMVLVSLMPALKQMLNMVQQSDALNCNGYVDSGDVDSSLSYNSSLETNTMACLAIKLYLPYILLAVLIGGVATLMAGGRREEGMLNY